MSFNENFSAYLERASNLLKSDNDIDLIYCSLELRRAIELIVWTQFNDAFSNKLFEYGITHLDYHRLKLQEHSISIIYDLLKKHITNYASNASQRNITIWSSGGGKYPHKEDGKACYIPPELPTSDYHYLSNILHYEKELSPKDNKPQKKELAKIHKRLMFVKKNYTNRFLTIDKEIKNIKSNINSAFNLNK